MASAAAHPLAADAAAVAQEEEAPAAPDDEVSWPFPPKNSAEGMLLGVCTQRAANCTTAPINSHF
jgi:hypothetical protein